MVVKKIFKLITTSIRFHKNRRIKKTWSKIESSSLPLRPYTPVYSSCYPFSVFFSFFCVHLHLETEEDLIRNAEIKRRLIGELSLAVKEVCIPNNLNLRLLSMQNIVIQKLGKFGDVIANVFFLLFLASEKAHWSWFGCGKVDWEFTFGSNINNNPFFNLFNNKELF